MIVETLPHLVSGLTDFQVFDGQFLWHLLADTPQVDADLWADVQKSWNHFIECGQVWALLVGLVVGWMVKSILP
jgi:hypothetical protein